MTCAAAKDDHVAHGLQNNLQTGTGGSCGFGPTGVTGYPDGAIASVNGNLTIVKGAPEKGCGACIQLTCVDAVSAQPFMHADIMFVHYILDYVWLEAIQLGLAKMTDRALTWNNRDPNVHH